MNQKGILEKFLQCSFSILTMSKCHHPPSLKFVSGLTAVQTNVRFGGLMVSKFVNKNSLIN